MAKTLECSRVNLLWVLRIYLWTKPDMNVKNWVHPDEMWTQYLEIILTVFFFFFFKLLFLKRGFLPLVAIFFFFFFYWSLNLSRVKCEETSASRYLFLHLQCWNNPGVGLRCFDVYENSLIDVEYCIHFPLLCWMQRGLLLQTVYFQIRLFL